MTDVLEKHYGRVVAVARKTYGSILTAPASIAATVLAVATTDDFDEDGGQVVIGGELYDYVAIDETASTITLATGLLAAADLDDFVELYDPEVGGIVVEYVADVLLDDQDPGDEPIEVTVQHGLVNMLAESIRGRAAEAVVLIRDGEDDFVIWQIDGKLAVDVVLEESVGAINDALGQLDADLTELNEVTLPAVQADLAELVTDLDGLSGLFPITSTSISDGAITTPKMTANSINGDRILANTLHAAKIVALSITGDRIAANAISADKIVANAISAGQLAATAIDGMTITGAYLRTASAGARVEISSGGAGKVMFYDSGGQVGYVGPAVGGLLFAGPGPGFAVMNGDSLELFGGARFKYDSVPTADAAANAYISVDGSIYKGNSSAERYKENFRSVELTSDEVLDAIDLVLFDYREEFGGYTDKLGVVADGAVGTPLENFVVFDGNQVENFDYGRAAFVLAHTVGRAQRQQIADLTARIEALEGK